MTTAPSIKEALERLIADIEDYERVNNLAPSPGKKDCWQSVTNAKAALSRQPSGERREAVARDTWASIEQYLRDECGLDCYGFSEGDRANCINVIVNADFLASGFVQDEDAIRADEREVAAQAVLAQSVEKK